MGKTTRRSVLKYSAATAALAAAGPLAGTRAWAQAASSPIRIGVLYDLTGPFTGAGSVPGSIGTQIAIDLINERGGILGKHKIEPIKGDAQSKADVALNEAERLMSQEKLDVILGIYASPEAIPLSEKMEQAKKILWITIAVATKVLKGKNLHYTFRPGVTADLYGAAAIGFLKDHAKAQLKIDLKKLKCAIIHEDGPYGSDTGAADALHAKEVGIPIVLDEAYSATTSDLSSLVTKLKRANADVILHTGYNPDITLFLRQAREAGLKFKMLIGHGAGYGQRDKLKQAFGTDLDYFLNVDPVAAQNLKPGTLKPELEQLVKVMVERYKKVSGNESVPPHVSMGFNQTWVFLQNVLPKAITKYGGTDAEAIRKAALDVDIPEGGTIQGYGVKFEPPGSEQAGQNLRAAACVTQAHGDVEAIVWPDKLKTANAVMPLPKSNPYAA
ncbi:MAG: ABC transporter substrate-binding protein [Alphaproteobacteria bacterium]|nr:ABC transporter substrate-binding protein [Alphaproteobacteria bacterium]